MLSIDEYWVTSGVVGTRTNKALGQPRNNVIDEVMAQVLFLSTSSNKRQWRAVAMLSIDDYLLTRYGSSSTGQC